MSGAPHQSGRVRIDFPGEGSAVESLSFSDPIMVIEARDLVDVRGAISAAESAAAAGNYVVGYISYEAAPAFDPSYRVRGGTRLPLVWFGVYGDPDGGEGPGKASRPGEVARATSPVRVSGWVPALSRGDYDSAISALHAAMASGDLEQANYTIRLRSEVEGDTEAWYHELLAAQGRAYGAYLELGSFRIISVSPELFFNREGNRIELRPMKGTARRGRWLEEDEERAESLAASVKDRSENLMTTSWIAGELEALARPGSVEVSRVCQVERYPTVLQMTSRVEGELVTGTGLEEVFGGLFPSASVAGVPRVPAMDRICELERTPREVYCGAVGVIRPGGDSTFNVAIRTIWLDMESGVAEYGVGGGITAGSTAAGEYDEVLAKSAVLTQPLPEFELLETMRLEGGRLLRLERHLARLGSSAAYFGWPDPRSALRAALAELAEVRRVGVWRVRALVAPDGTIRVEASEFGREGLGTDVGPFGNDRGLRGEEAPRREVRLAQSPVSRHDTFLYHKTTYRAQYEARQGESPDSFDLLLRNEEGELTEFTRGNLVVEVDGKLWTPPRDSGLLAGTFRGELLDRGLIVERVLRPDDLMEARQIWLINSLRGWVPVDLDLGP